MRWNATSRTENYRAKVRKDVGNILPLSMVMIFLILLSALGIGVVVMEGSQRAVETDQSVSAYYMSDSGIEKQLYEIRKNNQTLAYVNALDGTYINGGTWESTGDLEPTTSKQIQVVTTSSFAVLDIFDPDNLTTSLGIDNMRLTWQKDPSCTNPSARMEVGYAYWEIVAGVPQFPSDNQFVVLPKNDAYSMNVPLDPNKFYRIRLRTYDCAAINVNAAFTGSGAPVPYPGDITLSAEGTFGKTTQKIAATMPKLDILSGVFSYVIFSECTLLKGTGSITCP
ncbi:MAG: hypothetical protein RDU25_04010 [Patescibacteria group bacterium]|nr:hypothetical protein [Patescibacteria group bacterium]